MELKVCTSEEIVSSQERSLMLSLLYKKFLASHFLSRL